MRQFVCILKLAIIIRVLLNSVIGQMNELVAQVLHTELLARGSQIAILVEIAYQVSVDACQQPITPYVKLPLVYQQRVFNVLLDDCRLFHSS